MATYFFVCAERRDGERWVLADPLQPDPDRPGVRIPRDYAPPWSWADIRAYCELSGERGLPGDVTEEVRAYANSTGAVQTASWLTLASVQALWESETGDRIHLNADWFRHVESPPDRIRIVFWHD